MAPPGKQAIAWGAVVALLLTGAPPVGADDLDDDLGGFEDEADDDFSFEPIEEEEDELEEPWWDLDGSIAVSSSINYLSHESATGDDFTGVSRLRTRLNVQLDLELPRDWEVRVSPYIWYDLSYVINGFDNFTSEVLDEYEWEGDFQDSYAQGPIVEDVDLKFGRQVVNWGRSDSLRVLDVLNPLDNREPGRADIEDLRWSVGMAKLDWYIGPHWTLTGIAIPEVRFSTNPAVGSDFNPSPGPPLPDRKPDSFESWQAAAAVRGIFEGWDISFHYAYIFDDFGRLQPGGVPPSLLDPFGFELVHDRIHMGGAGGNYTFGAWLFKAELAGFYGYRYPFVAGVDDGGMPILGVTDRGWRLDALGGVEYYGFAETTLALEIVNRHVFDYTHELLSFPVFLRENSVEYAFRYTADWLNARLSTTLLALVFGYKAQDGAVLRAQADYDIRDGLVFTAGILIFQAGDLPPLDTWGRNDRVFLDLKWSF